jgi:hypothetical protein
MRNLILTGLVQPWSLPLNAGTHRVGRNPDNDIHLSEASISGFHCEIVVTEQGVLVKDMGSTNGTFIDGRQVSEQELFPDQVLQLGVVELRLEEQPVHIAIPALDFDHVPDSILLPDGHRSCINHPDTHATYHCPKCDGLFCDSCLHGLKLAGGKAHLFCPACSTPCEPMPETKRKPKRRSFFGRLTQTLKLWLR